VLLTFGVAPGVGLESDGIVVAPGSRRVDLSPAAVALVTYLHERPRTLAEIFAHVSRPDVAEATTREDTLAFLYDLSRLGALERRRSWRAARRLWSWRELMTLPLAIATWFDYGLLGMEPGRRGLRSILVLSAKSQAPLVLASVVVALAVVALPHLYDNRAARSVADPLAIAIVSFVVLHVALIAVHEYAHWTLARRLTGEALVVRRGVSVSVVYRPQQAAHTALVSAAGPLAAAVAAGVVAATLLLLAESGAGSVLRHAGLATCLLGLVHALSLTPFAGDGRSLWGALRAMGAPA
jgi:hypothetical protein